MIERFGSWIGHRISLGMAWFDHQPGGVQLVIVVLALLMVVCLMHVDDLARAREWHEFKCWRESQRRPLKGIKP